MDRTSRSERPRAAAVIAPRSFAAARRALAVACVLGALSFGGATGAHAETDAAAIARARQLHESGSKHYYLGEFEAALGDFKEAYRAKADPAFLFNIGQCEYKLGHGPEALHAFKGYLHLSKNPPNRVEAEARVAELQRTLRDQGAATPPRAPVPPAAASATPTPAAVSPAPPPAAVGSPPGAEPSSPPSPTPPSPAGSRRVVALVVGGAGVLALGIGGYFGVRAFSKWNDSNPHCPGGSCDDPGYESSQQARTAARVADVAIGAGLVAVGVAAYLLVTSGRSAAPATGGWRVEPAAGATGAGVLVGARW